MSTEYETRAKLAAAVPSTTTEILAWLRRHGLSDTPGIGAVLPVIRRDILGFCSACQPRAAHQANAGEAS